MANATNRELTRLTQTIAKETGKQYCTKCERDKDVEGGKWKPVTNNRRRWECAMCASKSTPSRFTFNKGVKNAGARVS